MEWTINGDPIGEIPDAWQNWDGRLDVILNNSNDDLFIQRRWNQSDSDVTLGALLPARPPSPSPRGYGRGLLAGGSVWWPCREEIFVFDQAVSEYGEPKQVRQPIQLLPRDVTGGNLAASDGILVIATAEELVAFGEFNRKVRDAQQ